MKKTNGLRDALGKTFADRRNWNRRIEVALLVGCFVLGKFVWCC